MPSCAILEGALEAIVGSGETAKQVNQVAVSKKVGVLFVCPYDKSPYILFGFCIRAPDSWNLPSRGRAGVHRLGNGFPCLRSVALRVADSLAKWLLLCAS